MIPSSYLELVVCTPSATTTTLLMCLILSKKILRINKKIGKFLQKLFERSFEAIF